MKQYQMSHKKRDFLIEIETRVQKKWQAEQIFEVSAPGQDSETEKYFATFPYPYMNGRLHLGHAYTLAKADFQANYQRLQGKQVLFPFGFHCTGMPIKASADRLQEEIETYGYPPQFPEESVQLIADPQSKPKGKSKKNKTVSKTGTAKRQWQILQSSGVPEHLIPNFVDPQYWLGYFPTLARDDLVRMGCGIDFRRSFLTTEVNPYYDSFIRWQFRQLESKGYLKFGKRESIYSPKDQQICADHDRSSGEGIDPQEYTLIKMKVVNRDQTSLNDLPVAQIYLLAATLRPETMYGQTNAWILPEGEYGCYQIEKLPDQILIMSEHAARNLAYQDWGEVQLIKTISGSDLIGTCLVSPLSLYQHFFLLPMISISMQKGTGIVTSVPSDAPHDYLCLKTLQDKPIYREKLGLLDEWVIPFEVVPIIQTKKYGEFSAQRACEEFKIQSPNDANKLNLAKEEVYKAGFYDGVFLSGPYQGKPVSEVKEQIKNELIEQGDAMRYWEPTSQVISRSGDKCVVALTDQWYLDYSNPIWKQQVIDYVEHDLECYQSELKDLLLYYVKWLKMWGCSRSFGLGTKLPQDPHFLIESLSDSTVYMAYYTIAHLLHGGNLNPHQVVVGPAGITPEMLNTHGDAIWNYIFLDGVVPSVPDNELSPEMWELLRTEFRYWYPWDLRVSGKDLVYNHLPFSLFHHCAIFPKKFWPRSIKCGGFLQINGMKMSKSEGNFLTLEEAIQEYSAMVIRMTLADSGDNLEVANFVHDEANKIVLRLYTQLEWIDDFFAMEKSPTSGHQMSEYSILETMFEHQIRQAIHETDNHYRELNYASALKSGFFDLQNHRDRYLNYQENMNRDLIRRFIEVQILLMAPIIPQWSDYIWQKYLGHQESILTSGRWPISPQADPEVLKEADYLSENCHRFHQKREYFIKRNQKAPHNAFLHVCETYPSWQMEVIRIFQEVGPPYDKKAIIRQFSQNDQLKIYLGKRSKKPVMPFTGLLINELRAGKPDHEVLRSESMIQEYNFWTKSHQLVQEQLGVENLEIILSDDPEDGKKGQPMKPVIIFE